MQLPQIESADGRVELKFGERRASLLLDGQLAASFDVTYEETLSARSAERLTERDPARSLIAFNRSSPQARAILRKLGLSYASAAGELYVHAPPVHVEIPPRRSAFPVAAGRSSAFAIKSSRVPRWLLLHATARPSVSDLSAETALDASVVSRALSTLRDDGFVAVKPDPLHPRRRIVQLRRPADLLEAFERAVAGRRIIQRTWDIGASDTEEALKRWRRAAKRSTLPYAIGGLAGASMLARVVEPATVDVWIERKDVDAWVDELSAAPGRPRPGAVTLRAIPDPFVLSLRWSKHSLWIADPVQLFLDCRLAGERAIDAAEAIREEMGW